MTCEYDPITPGESGRWLYGPCRNKDGTIFVDRFGDQFHLTFKNRDPFGWESVSPRWEISNKWFTQYIGYRPYQNHNTVLNYAPDESNEICMRAGLTWQGIGEPIEALCVQTEGKIYIE